MPYYEYKCECSPEDIVTFERSIKDDAPDYFCEKDNCGKQLKQNYSSFGIQFRGGGFYSTGG
jgi:predicted nucleic acid-binding Zn ribbon protein